MMQKIACGKRIRFRKTKERRDEKVKIRLAQGEFTGGNS